jgi:cell division protein FtsI/penicillin-binding protein 2
VLPLSLSKLFLSASWWDNQQPDASFDSSKGTANARNPAYRDRVSVHEMLVGGSDSAGRQMAVALRSSVGTEAVIRDFKRYGFGQRVDPAPDDSFWAELAPTWRARVIPAPAYASLSDQMKDAEWADTLSIGETNFNVTALHVSRFLQAVGNNGMMQYPVAREEQPTPSIRNSQVLPQQIRNPIRVIQKSTALKLQSAMIDTVQRGTANGIAKVLVSTGWQIGGKTGTGPGPAPIGSESDGWFAGLIFDPQGKARFTIATFVRHGGPGGGNAAKFSAELAHYIIGESNGLSR